MIFSLLLYFFLLLNFIVYYFPDPVCTDGDVRLVGGANDSEGNVEVCVNGAWGSVCGLTWSENEAIVVCEQLGFEGNGEPHHVTTNLLSLVVT